MKTLQEEIIPSVVNKFGQDVELLKCELDDVVKGEAQYASTVVFAKVTLRSDSGKIKEYPVVVKYELSDKDVRRWLKLDEQFYNEVYMYEIVLPFLDRNRAVQDLFPKFYYGVATLGERPDKDIVVLQNLREDGFRLTTEKVFLDYNHVVLAMRALGRFHALSYAAKQLDPEGFMEKANILLETRFTDDGTENNYYLFKYSVQRAVQPFLDQGKHVDIINKFKKKLENIKEFLSDLLKTSEKMSVICHGDYCRNNVLYRYDDGGQPVAMKMFDIATARLSSPVIDIAFFLFLNTTSELRRKHWDDFLATYHEALRMEVPSVIVVPTLEDVHEEMRKKAVSGFLTCSYFLPSMTSNAEFDAPNYVKLSPEDKGKGVLHVGGEKDTRYVSDIFEDLVLKNCAL